MSLPPPLDNDDFDGASLRPAAACLAVVNSRQQISTPTSTIVLPHEPPDSEPQPAASSRSADLVTVTEPRNQPRLYAVHADFDDVAGSATCTTNVIALSGDPAASTNDSTASAISHARDVDAAAASDTSDDDTQSGFKGRVQGKKRGAINALQTASTASKRRKMFLGKA